MGYNLFLSLFILMLKLSQVWSGGATFMLVSMSLCILNSFAIFYCKISLKYRKFQGVLYTIYLPSIFYINILLFCTDHSLSTPLFSGTVNCSRLFLPHLWIQPFIEEPWLLQWYLEALGVLTSIGVLLLRLSLWMELGNIYAFIQCICICIYICILMYVYSYISLSNNIF